MVSLHVDQNGPIGRTEGAQNPLSKFLVLLTNTVHQYFDTFQSPPQKKRIFELATYNRLLNVLAILSYIDSFEFSCLFD